MRRPSILTALAALLLAACATATGPDAAGRFDRFEGASADFRRFDAVYVAPVEISDEIAARIDTGGTSLGRRDARPLGERDIERNKRELAEAVRAEVGSAARLADAPGPGVLTVALTLTSLDANRPTMAEQRANPGLSFDSVAVGGAGVTGELREGNTVLATFSDQNAIVRITDPGVGTGLWTVADRFYRQLGDKLAGLLRD